MASLTCDAFRTACPDTLIVHWQGRYALPVRDGGRSTIAIAFCPWCGVPLPRR